MKRSLILTAVLMISLALPGCRLAPTASPLYPTERPVLDIPAAFTLTGAETLVKGQRYGVDSDISGYRFEDCEVIIADDLEIASTEFINCQVIVDYKKNVTFKNTVFRGLNQYEQTALRVSGSENVWVSGCQFLDNFIGLGIQSSGAIVTGNRFLNNNGHNALVIGEGSSALVSGNYFYGSFPHAILILNRGGSPGASISITGNVIDQSGEDAVDFEDYRNASPSIVSHNLITNTGWAAINVEYNSWQANITIQDNWIEGTGIDWALDTHPLQPEVFQSGWGHGILIEDSSQVRVEHNRITSASGNGIEIRNGRDVRVEGNGIDSAGVAIAAHEYTTGSLYREFSPLSPENAGGSQAVARDNVIFGASKDYEADAASELQRD